MSQREIGRPSPDNSGIESNVTPGALRSRQLEGRREVHPHFHQAELARARWPGDISWKLVDGKRGIRMVRQRIEKFGLQLSERSILETMVPTDYDRRTEATVELIHEWVSV